MTKSYDVLVLGAGIAGVSSAAHLVQRGKRVALVDRKDPGEETSYGNTGAIEASSVMPYAFPKLSKLWAILNDRDTSARADWRHLPAQMSWLLQLRRDARDDRRLESSRAMRPLLATCVAEHKALMALAGSEHFVRQIGWAKLYRSQASFDGEALARTVCEEYGVPFEVMSPAEYTGLEPHVKPNFFKAVWLKDTATVTSPGGVTKSYGAWVGRNGGAVVRGDASSLRQSQAGGWSVDTAEGVLTAPDVVVALGPWSMDVLRPLGYRFPLGIKRGYHLHFRAEGNAVMERALVDVDKGYCIAPMLQGYRITTGAEFTDRDAPPNPVQIDRVLPFARQLFPIGEAAEPTPWMGRRPCFPDSLPIVGRAGRHQGLWCNFGHGHLGFTMGPVTGRLVAEMMTGGPTLCDPTPYRAERF